MAHFTERVTRAGPSGIERAESGTASPTSGPAPPNVAREGTEHLLSADFTTVPIYARSSARDVREPAQAEPAHGAWLSRLGPGRALDAPVRKRMESTLDHDLAHVRIHDDSTAATLSRDLGAQAFTVAEHVAFAEGGYRPGVAGGDRLLAHELAHVIQQSGGYADAVTHDRSNGDAALEADADHSADGVVRSLSSPTGLVGLHSPRLRGGVRLACRPAQPPRPEPANDDVDRLTIVEQTPDDFIAQFTSTMGTQLDETAMGNALLGLALRSDEEIAFVLSVLDALWASDRDDVAHAFAEPATDSQLRALAASASGRKLLQRLSTELSGFPSMPSESAEVQRIDAALGSNSTAEGDPTALEVALKRAMVDEALGSGDWPILRQAGAGLDESKVYMVFSGAGFDGPAAQSLALMVAAPSARVTMHGESFELFLTPDVVPQLAANLVADVLDDKTIDRDEFEMLRQFYGAMRDPLTDELSASASLDARALRPLLAMIRYVGAGSGQVPGTAQAFPMRLEEAAGGTLSASEDLAAGLLTELVALNHWDFETVKLVDAAISAYRPEEAAGLLQGAGIAADDAGLIVANLGRITQSRRDLSNFAIEFVTSDQGQRLTEASAALLTLPEFADQSHPLPSAESPKAKTGVAELRHDVTISLASEKSLKVDAHVATLSTASTSIEVVVPISARTGFDTFAESLRGALGHLPPNHAALIHRVISYPGLAPGGHAGADSGRGGTIRMLNSEPIDAAIFVHETGHLVRDDAVARIPGFWSKWLAAIDSDGVAPSLYGLSSVLEDFAESYYLYLASAEGTTNLRQRYPARFALLDMV